MNQTSVMWTLLTNYAMGWIMFNFLEETWVILALEPNNFLFFMTICHTHVVTEIHCHG